MNILDILFHHTHDDGQTFGTGETARPDIFKQPNAYLHSEISGAFQPVRWVEKKLSDFVTYPKRNQGMQSTCTAYTLAKQLGIDELSENGVWRELSPRSVYPYTVAPGGGANSLNATKTAAKIGMTLEYLLPTDGLSEADVEKDAGYATDAKQIALVYKPGSFIECNTDFETIASIIQGFRDQGIKKAVAVTVIGKNNGTWTGNMPVPPDGPQGVWYHRVPVVDFGLVGGKPKLAIDNSWGTGVGNGGQQYLGKEYEPFMYGGIYTLNQPDNWQQMGPSPIQPPSHQWLSDMQVGMTSPDVMALQVALQSMGMFPVQSIVKPTGYFGGLTRASMIVFQAAFGLPQTGVADQVTRMKLNEIFKV